MLAVAEPSAPKLLILVLQTQRWTWQQTPLLVVKLPLPLLLGPLLRARLAAQVGTSAGNMIATGVRQLLGMSSSKTAIASHTACLQMGNMFKSLDNSQHAVASKQARQLTLY